MNSYIDLSIDKWTRLILSLREELILWTAENQLLCPLIVDLRCKLLGTSLLCLLQPKMQTKQTFPQICVKRNQFSYTESCRERQRQRETLP